MNSKFLVSGTIVGGIVLFFWGFVVNAMLPWPGEELRGFTDDSAVTEVLRVNAPANGVYLSDSGIFAAVAFMPDLSSRTASFLPYLAVEVLNDFFIAFLLTALLLKSGPASPIKGATFLAIAALAAGAAGPISDWNWYGFSTAYTTKAIFELVAGWLLLGFMLTSLRDRLGEGGRAFND